MTVPNYLLILIDMYLPNKKFLPLVLTSYTVKNNQTIQDFLAFYEKLDNSKKLEKNIFIINSNRKAEQFIYFDFFIMLQFYFALKIVIFILLLGILN